MILAKSIRTESISIRISISSQIHTDESLLTPETQISWVTRFPAKIIYGPENVDDGVDRLPRPCLMSGTRNKNMGKDKKC
jgi:hypothetical protein